MENSIRGELSEEECVKGGWSKLRKESSRRRGNMRRKIAKQLRCEVVLPVPRYVVDSIRDQIHHKLVLEIS
jgi:hypothetical protein